MESKYSEVLKVDVPRGVLVKMLSDPMMFLLATGHFVVIRKLDNGNYLAALINDGEEGRTKQESYYGQLYPVSMAGSSFVYRGESFDKKIRLNASVDLSFMAKDNSINITIDLVADDKSFLGIGKVKFPVTAEHIIKNHVIPFMKRFSCLIREADESWLVDPMDVAKYVMMKAKQLKEGIITVHNCDVYAAFKIEGGEIKASSGKFRNLLITGNDVLIRLMQEKEKLVLEIADTTAMNIMEVLKEIL
jgi:hypothetical protein